MTSQHGYYEYFDYDTFKTRCIPQKIVDFEYPKDSLMAAIIDRFPRFAQIIIKAKYDRTFCDGRYTAFVSDFWEKYSTAQIDNLDVGDAKNIVMTTCVQGRIRQLDLMTSQDSQLNSLDTSVYIHIWVDADKKLRKDNDYILDQVETSNGILHILKDSSM